MSILKEVREIELNEIDSIMVKCTLYEYSKVRHTSAEKMIKRLKYIASKNIVIDSMWRTQYYNILNEEREKLNEIRKQKNYLKSLIVVSNSRKGVRL